MLHGFRHVIAAVTEPRQEVAWQQNVDPGGLTAWGGAVDTRGALGMGDGSSGGRGMTIRSNRGWISLSAALALSLVVSACTAGPSGSPAPTTQMAADQTLR